MSAPTQGPHATRNVFDTDDVSFEAMGGDWDDVAARIRELGEERIVVNMGPQHPSTHGVLRLMLEMDGEYVTEARAGVGTCTRVSKRTWSTEPSLKV